MTEPCAPIRDVSLTVAVQVRETTAWCSLDGELEERSAPILLGMLGHLAPGSVATVILDCGHLGFIDARGLTALLRARELVARAGAELRLARPSGMLQRILAATMLTDQLPVLETQPDVSTVR